MLQCGLVRSPRVSQTTACAVCSSRSRSGQRPPGPCPACRRTSAQGLLEPQDTSPQPDHRGRDAERTQSQHVRRSRIPPIRSPPPPDRSIDQNFCASAPDPERQERRHPGIPVGDATPNCSRSRRAAALLRTDRRGHRSATAINTSLRRWNHGVHGGSYRAQIGSSTTVRPARSSVSARGECAKMSVG